MTRIIRQSVAFEGQKFLDEPQHVVVSKARPLAMNIAALFGRPVDPEISEFSHYERTRLRWMRPGPDGQLVPKE